MDKNMSIQRQPGWETKLRLFTDAASSSTFSWGINDCCSMTCDWIKLCTDVDVYADFRGKYTTKIGAYRAIKSVTDGGTDEESAADYVTTKYGMASVPILMAQRGDVVLFEAADGSKRLGIVSLHPARSLFLTEAGIGYEATNKCKRAWKV